jgi:hypothetical protein
LYHFHGSHQSRQGRKRQEDQVTEYPVVYIPRDLSENKSEFNASLLVTDSDGMTVLHHACKFGFLSVVKIIMGFENALKILDQKDTVNQWTPLVYAIYSQDDGGPEIIGI